MLDEVCVVKVDKLSQKVVDEVAEITLCRDFAAA